VTLTATVSAMPLNGLVQVEVWAAGQSSGLSVLVTPQAALALQSQLAAAIITASGDGLGAKPRRNQRTVRRVANQAS